MSEMDWSLPDINRYILVDQIVSYKEIFSDIILVVLRYFLDISVDSYISNLA